MNQRDNLPVMHAANIGGRRVTLTGRFRFPDSAALYPGYGWFRLSGKQTSRSRASE
jgi:hypothetical protein